MFNELEIIKVIESSWGWTGIQPIKIISDNAFGNLIIQDVNNRYWRLCPEDLYCNVVAENTEEFKKLSSEDNFLQDWCMETLSAQSSDRLGELAHGEKYCFVVPCVLGGEYSANNIKKVLLKEIIGLSGDIAKQIENLPDGAQVKLKLID